MYPPVEPEDRKFYPNKAITMLVGEPVNFNKMIESRKINNFDDEMQLIEDITDELQV